MSEEIRLGGWVEHRCLDGARERGIVLELPAPGGSLVRVSWRFRKPIGQLWRKLRPARQRRVRLESLKPWASELAKIS